MESFIGYIKSPEDAFLIFEACRKGALNRVQRRLTGKERMDIHSGSVFAFDEREAGMRRWTDGRTWSPSRVLGSFLTYRELDTKRRPRRPSPGSGKKHASFSYKQNGLIKQSFSICTAANQKIHLISYYNKADVLAGRLQRPCQNPVVNAVEIPKGLYPELNPLNIGGGQSSMLYATAAAAQRHDSISTYSSTSSSSPSLSPPLSFLSISTNSPQSLQQDDFQEQHQLLSPLAPVPKIQFLQLPIQDIAWEKLPCSEDIRQLTALRTQVSFI